MGLTGRKLLCYHGYLKICVKAATSQLLSQVKESAGAGLPIGTCLNQWHPPLSQCPSP
jgi:hypothetical protein